MILDVNPNTKTVDRVQCQEEFELESIVKLLHVTNWYKEKKKLGFFVYDDEKVKGQWAMVCRTIKNSFSIDNDSSVKHTEESRMFRVT